MLPPNSSAVGFHAGGGGIGDDCSAGRSGGFGAGFLRGTFVGTGFEPSTKSASGFLLTVLFAPCCVAFRRRFRGAFGCGGSPVRGAPG